MVPLNVVNRRPGEGTPADDEGVLIMQDKARSWEGSQPFRTLLNISFRNGAGVMERNGFALRAGPCLGGFAVEGG